MGARPVPEQPDAPVGAPDIVAEAIDLIRQRGGRSTTSRRAVLEALIAAGGNRRTAEQLAHGIQAAYPSINESTVYRNLELLEELGLVSHVHLGHGPSQWQLSSRRHQWYLTCSACGAVIDTDLDAFDALVSDVERRTGFRIDSGHFAITGTCAACRGEARGRGAGERGAGERGAEGRAGPAGPSRRRRAH
jgi:Fur family ferric uptake transcriptional regulator